MNIEQAIQQIQKEFATAQHAASVGNNGMVRVCARRAAGIAIGLYRVSFPESTYANDAINQLNQLQTDTSFSEDARKAAERLTAKVTQQFTSPFSENPLDDATIIIHEVKAKFSGLPGAKF